MARGVGRGYLTYAAYVLLSTASTASAFDCLWCVSIDESPAPSPEDGPPFSAHATRDRGRLPYEIVGIIAGYIGSILILGLLLLTVGRTSRKRAQNMTVNTKGTEMVKPMGKTFDPSPISPGSNRSWYSPRKLRGKKSATSSIRSGRTNQLSPGMESTVSFDANVIEADRQKRNEEMERLYAAVMAQDERKATASTTELPSGAPPEYSRKNPPQLQRLERLQADSTSNPASPHTPKSPVRAIYPPDSPMPEGPQSTTSPIRAEYPATPLTPNYPPTPIHSTTQQERQQGHLRPSRERTYSGGSGRTVDSSASGSKKLRKSLKNIKISAPIVKQDDDNSDGARTPLSPRFYTDPGIPPEPPTARTVDTIGTAVTGDSDYPPTTPGTGRSFRYGEEYGSDEEQMDEVRDLPQANPQRLSAFNYGSQAQAITDAASTRRDPTGSSSANKPSQADAIAQANAAAAAAGNGALPFRQYHWNQPGSPYYPYQHAQGNPWSADPTKTTFGPTPTKTTFLDARRPGQAVGMTPRTGQATPYSPYMPFTPLTPITPHLTTRTERKQREKEEKRLKGVLEEGDEVADDKDLWSSGY